MATLSQITEAVYRSRFEDQMTAGASAAAKSMRDLGVAVVETDERVARAGKSANQLVNQLDPVTKATKGLERAQRDLASAQKTLAAEVTAGGVSQEKADRATAALSDRVRKATEHLSAVRAANAGANDAMLGLGNSAKLTARELQQLSPQLADIGVSLAGGMNPMLVLIQQGPQIVDAVGGIGRAFALARASISPFAVAAAAAAVAIGGAVIAAESQERALASLSNRLRATRADYAALSTTVEAAARAAAGSTTISTADARSAGQVIAGQRNFGGSQGDLQNLIDLSNRLSIVMGTTATEAAGKLADALARPGEAARQMAEQGLRTMDEGLVRSITRLENQGNIAEAARLALDAYNRAAGEVARTPLQAALAQLEQAFTRLWQAVRPVVDLLGSAMARALAFIVDRLTAMVSALGTLARMLGDSRVARLLFGEGGAPTIAQPQRSPTELALERARQANPRGMQREDIQDRLQGYRAGLAGASPEDAGRIRDAMRELQGQMEGMRGPVADYLHGLEQQARLARVAEGAARELAAAEQALNEAARQDGQGQASAAAIAEARRLVQQRLREEMLNGLVVLNREITGQQDIAAAYASGNAAGMEAERVHRAMTEALRTEEEGTDRYAALVATLTVRYRAQAEAVQSVRDAQALLDQSRQLETIQRETELLGANVVVRERELAMLRERQAMIARGDSVTPAEAQQRIANAGQIAEATLALTRQRDAYNELARIGEQAFDRIGSAITQAFANGSLKALDFRAIATAVFSEIIQAGLRLAVLNPVINSLFGQNRATAFDVIGAGGGGMSSLFSVGGMIGNGGSLSSLFSVGGMIGNGGSLSGLFGGGATASAPVMGANGMLAGGGAQSVAAPAAGLGVGSALVSIGGGYMIGSTIGGMLAGRSQARAQNSQIGAGIGAGAGFLVGGPVGALIGGTIGGAGGGLIGPGPKTNAYGFALSSSGNQFSADGYRSTGNGAGGAEALAQVNSTIAQLNAALAANNVAVNDNTRVINGQTNSADQSKDFAAALANFQFSSQDPILGKAINGKSFNSLEDLVNALQAPQRYTATFGNLVSRGRTLGNFLDQTALSTGSAQSQFGAAQEQFQAAIAAARAAGPDMADLGRVSQAGGTLLQANSAYYGSGAQAAAIERMVKSTVITLGGELDLPGFTEDVTGSIERASDRANNAAVQQQSTLDALREEVRGLRMVIERAQAA